MIDWRDVRSQSDLKEFSDWFNTQTWDIKEPILKEMTAFLDETPIRPRQVEGHLRVDEPRKPQRKPRGTRKRIRRR